MSSGWPACASSATAAAAPLVGLFDSGVGGLAVWRAVTERLPAVRTLCLADNAHCPYGRRPPDAVRTLACRCTEALLAEGCDLIVVACNTATAAAIEALRGLYDVPFVGMEPAVKPAARQSRSGVIGVLATAGTLDGALYRGTVARFAGGVRVVVRVGEGLVELVEAGKADSAEAFAAVADHLRPMLAEGIDQLVLGCTHFPFLRRHIEAVVGPGVTVIDPAPAVACQVARRLEQAVLAPARAVAAAPPVAHRFAASGDAAVLRRMLAAMGWESVATGESLADATPVFAARRAPAAPMQSAPGPDAGRSV